MEHCKQHVVSLHDDGDDNTKKAFSDEKVEVTKTILNHMIVTSVTNLLCC